MKAMLFAVIFFGLSSSVMALDVTDQTQVSLITFSPGQELYAAFGHSAIRIADKGQGYDLLFGYGAFDFNQPHFYANFVYGKMNYTMTISDFNGYFEHESRLGRYIREQDLALNPSEIQRLVQLLSINYRPENRAYKYDFFYDNCATRLPLMIQKTLGDRIRFQRFEEGTKTFRDMLDPYLTAQGWLHFGINSVLGLPTDRRVSIEESFFLPDYLEKGFSKAMLLRDGTWISLVNSTRVLNPAPQQAPVEPFFNPTLILWLLLALGLAVTAVEVLTRKRFAAFDVALFFLAGLLGIVICFLWFLSDHTAVSPNLNLLWTLPTNFFLSFLLIIKKRPLWLRWHYLAVAVGTLIALVVWFCGPQRLDPGHLPLILLLALRSLCIFVNAGKIGRQVTAVKVKTQRSRKD